MKNASDWMAIVLEEITPLDDQGKILLHNLLLQVQADAFEHAAGLVDKALREVDVKGPGLLLRATARAIWPGHGTQAPIAEPVEKTQLGPDEGQSVISMS